MGMSSSQARLLTLTSRLHSIEISAQKIEAEKLRLANDSNRVYENYLNKIEATKLQYKALQADGTLTYKDATLNSMENGIVGNWGGETSKDVLFMQTQEGKILVTPAVAAKYGLTSTATENRDLDTFVHETTGKNKAEKDVMRDEPIIDKEKHMVDKEVDDTTKVLDFTKVANVQTQAPSFTSSHNYNPVANVEGGIDYSALDGYAKFDESHNASTTGAKAASTVTDWSTASGTYTISSADELKALSGKTISAGVTLVLANDIDMSGVTGWAGITNFKGTFDGNGHKISNLTGTQGLFAATENATIQNVGLENININGNSDYIGGLIGSAKNTSVNNCYTSGTVKNSNTTSASGLTSANCNVGTGGLIGYIQTVNNGVYNYSNIYSSANVNGYDNVGGLIGSSSSRNTDLNISNAYAIGNVTGHNNVGGMAGHMYNDQDTSSVLTDINKVYAGGNVTGNDNVGGFFGSYLYWGDLGDYSKIIDCNSSGKVNGTGSNKGAFAGHLWVKMASATESTLDQYLINFINCGFADNTGVRDAYGTITDESGNTTATVGSITKPIDEFVKDSGSGDGLVSFKMAGSIPSIENDGTGDYMDNIIAVLIKAGAYDPCDPNLSAADKATMEGNIKRFIQSFNDNDTDNTKLWYLNEAINKYLKGTGNADLGEKLANDINNGTTTQTSSYQTGAALDGKVGRASATGTDIYGGTHTSVKGKVTIPSLNNIGQQLYYALKKAGLEADETTVKNWVNTKYSASNKDDKMFLANLNNDIQAGANLGIIKQAIDNGTKYENAVSYPVDKYDITVAGDKTITPTYGKKTIQEWDGTYDDKIVGYNPVFDHKEYYWDTTDPDIANAIAMYAMAKRGVTVVTDEQASSYKWLVNMANSGEAVFTTFDPSKVEVFANMSEAEINNMTDEEYNDLMGIKNTSVSVETYMMEVKDQKDVKKAEAEYEADMKKINRKDKQYDTELAACETERNAIKEECDTLKNVAKENVDRTFKLFS